MDLDIKYIKITIFLLKKIIGMTFPNPPVVSLIVESNSKKTFNKIVSFGYTFEGGRPQKAPRSRRFSRRYPGVAEVQPSFGSTRKGGEHEKRNLSGS